MIRNSFGPITWLPRRISAVARRLVACTELSNRSSSSTTASISSGSRLSR
jgi:hypothetical protein